MWAQRAARARSLADKYPASQEILLFYSRLAEWQGRAASSSARPEDLLPALVGLVRQAAPRTLREVAEGLTALPDLDAPAPWSFFALAARQPGTVAPSAEAQNPEAPSPECPQCGRPPQAGCLITRGEGQALELVCSLCFSRWSFPRARCPSCSESAEGRLVSYSAPDFEHLRLQACETCKAYLHLVDLTKDPLAIPEVDELAALPLDLWAIEHGYHKIHPNLAGI